jgi:LppX_LprAFG lipoprotein
MVAMLVAVAGCGSVQPQQQSDALKILQAAARSTAALESVQLDFKFGPGFQIGGIGLVSAVGKFKAPADSDIVAKASTGQAFVEPELLTVGGKIYIKLFQLQAFRELPASEAQQYPNVARMLDKDHGLAPSIARGRNSKVTGTEQVDGVDCDKVEATYGPNELNQALAPVHLTNDIRVLLWIDRSDHFVRKVRFEGQLTTAGQNTFAEAHLHDFNRPVDIPSPS